MFRVPGSNGNCVSPTVRISIWFFSVRSFILGGNIGKRPLTLGLSRRAPPFPPRYRAIPPASIPRHLARRSRITRPLDATSTHSFCRRTSSLTSLCVETLLVTPQHLLRRARAAVATWCLHQATTTMRILKLSPCKCLVHHKTPMRRLFQWHGWFVRNTCGKEYQSVLT